MVLSFLTAGTTTLAASTNATTSVVSLHDAVDRAVTIVASSSNAGREVNQGSDEQENEVGGAIGVEDEGKQQERVVPELLGRDEIRYQKDRQEEEEEYVTTEYHLFIVFFFFFFRTDDVNSVAAEVLFHGEAAFFGLFFHGFVPRGVVTDGLHHQLNFFLNCSHYIPPREYHASLILHYPAQNCKLIYD